MITVNKKAEEEFYKCQFKFINNAALPDSIVDNAHFRAMITYAIDNANLLKKLKHMGPRKFISIQFASFDGLLRTVHSCPKCPGLANQKHCKSLCLVHC